MGAAGDMLSAALLELFPDPDAVINRLNSLGIPEVVFEKEPVFKCGILGTHMKVTVRGEEEESADVMTSGVSHDHDHAHDHGHSHDHGGHHHHHGSGHVHRNLADIRSIVAGLDIPDKVRQDIMEVYSLIAEAESHAHGRSVEEIHFHEVGAMDAVADITAVCLMMNELAPEKIIASPVNVGFGNVRCAHGILPVPAPATAWILRGIPVYAGRTEGELCTPTGAALLKHFATEFGPLPRMRVRQIGIGCGKKDFEQANCVRAMLGEIPDSEEIILELS